MVRRWSASAAVDWRLASRLLDARHHATAIPVLQVLPSEWILMLERLHERLDLLRASGGMPDDELDRMSAG